MSYIFYFSQMCSPSRSVLQSIQNRQDIHFICIDKRINENGKTYIILESGQKIVLPETVERVPALLFLSENYRVIYGNDILSYFANKTNFSPSMPSSSSAALPPLQQQQTQSHQLPGNQLLNDKQQSMNLPSYERNNMSTGGPPSSAQYPVYANPPADRNGPNAVDPDAFSFSAFSSNIGFSDSFSFIGLHPEVNSLQQMRNFVGINEGMGLSESSERFDAANTQSGNYSSRNNESNIQQQQLQQFQQQQQQQQHQQQQIGLQNQNTSKQDRIPSFVNSEYLTNLRNSELQNFRR